MTRRVKCAIRQTKGAYNFIMFDPIGIRPRGFSGRPLAALLFAVGLGIGEYYVGSWLHLSNVISFAVVVATLGLVAGIWHWIERPK